MVKWGDTLNKIRWLSEIDTLSIPDARKREKRLANPVLMRGDMPNKIKK